MRTYELTYIIPEKYEEKEILQISEKIKKFLPDGKIIKEYAWGRRQLAYPISKNKFGYYVTLTFKTEPELLSKMTSKLKLEEDVIRHQIVAVKEIKKPEPEKKVKKIEEKPKKEEKPKEIERPKVRVKAKPKKVSKSKKEKITKEIEKEEEKMKALEEKLEEILKE